MIHQKIKDKAVRYLNWAATYIKSEEWEYAKQYLQMAQDEIKWLEEHPEKVFIKGEPL